MEIRQFRKSDIRFLKMDGKFEVLFKKNVKARRAYTVTDNGKIIFCTGTTPMWDGVCELWFRAVDYSRAFTIVRLGAEMLLKEIQKRGLHRIQATVRADDPKAMKCVSFMGFTQGERMEQFNADKTDSYMYSLVIK